MSEPTAKVKKTCPYLHDQYYATCNQHHIS